MANLIEAVMGFITPDLPDVDPETWHTRSAADRMQVVTRHWVEHGFGTPSAVYLLYGTAHRASGRRSEGSCTGCGPDQF